VVLLTSFLSRTFQTIAQNITRCLLSTAFEIRVSVIIVTFNDVFIGSVVK
jgi:hypothetical protein